MPDGVLRSLVGEVIMGFEAKGNAIHSLGILQADCVLTTPVATYLVNDLKSVSIFCW